MIPQIPIQVNQNQNQNQNLPSRTASNLSQKITLPLPTFIKNFLNTHQVQFTNNSINFKPQNYQSDNYTSISKIRIPFNIRNQFAIFLSYLSTLPSKLYVEMYQILYPLLIVSAKALRENDFNQNEWRTFLSNYKKEFPYALQRNIESIIQNPENFPTSPFHVHFSPYASEYFNQMIYKHFVLLNFSLGRDILIDIEPNHKLSFINEENSIIDKQSIQHVQNNNLSLQPLTVRFTPKNSQHIPQSQEQFIVPCSNPEESAQYPTQDLPDIIHLTMYNHDGHVTCSEVSKCGRLFATAEFSSIIVSSLDPSTTLGSQEALVECLMQHSGDALCLSISDDSQYIVSGGMDSEIRVGQTEAFLPFVHFRWHQKPVISVAWAHHGVFCLGASLDKMISMWDLRSPNLIRLFGGNSLPSNKVMFSSERDSKTVFGCSNDMAIRLWDVGTGKMMSKFFSVTSTPVVLDVSPDNKYIACGCDDGSLEMWSLEKGELIWKETWFFSHKINDIKFTADGTLLIAVDEIGNLSAWTVEPMPKRVIGTQFQGTTLDSINVTNYNLIITTGRSLRGNVTI